MNTGDLQYVAGSLYVSGTVVAKNIPEGGGSITSVTVAGGAPLVASTAGSTVTLSYAAPGFGGSELPPETVPVNSLIGFDSVGVGSGADIVIPLVGNVAFSGGQKLLGPGSNDLPKGGIWVESIASSAVPGLPVGTDGTVLITNVGIGSITAGDDQELTFTGYAARPNGSGEPLLEPSPGNVTFAGGSGIAVSSAFASEGDPYGSGVVTISNSGVTSVGLPADTQKRSRLGAAVAAASGDIVLAGAGDTVITQEGSTFTFTSTPGGVRSIAIPNGSPLTGDVSFEPAGYTQLTQLGNVITISSLQNAAGTGISIAENPVYSTITNTGVTSAVAGAGISVSGATGAVTVANTGILSASASGAGLSASTASGVLTLSNTGVTSAVAGTGISVSGASGAVTVANTGVTQVTAGYGLEASASTGAVTLANTGVVSLVSSDEQVNLSGQVLVQSFGTTATQFLPVFTPTSGAPEWVNNVSYAPGSITYAPSGSPPTNLYYKTSVAIPAGAAIPGVNPAWVLLSDWASGTVYAIGDHVRAVSGTGFACFQAIRSGSTSVQPQLDTTHWIDPAAIQAQLNFLTLPIGGTNGIAVSAGVAGTSGQVVQPKLVAPGPATTSGGGTGGFLGYYPPGTSNLPFTPVDVSSVLTVTLAPTQYSAWISVPNLTGGTTNQQPVYVYHPLATGDSTYTITPAFDASDITNFRVGDIVVGSVPAQTGSLFGAKVLCTTAAALGSPSKVLFCITFSNPAS